LIKSKDLDKPTYPGLFEMAMKNNPQIILQGRYMMVARSLILLIKEKKVLLIKAPQTKKIWPGYYNGLGGHVENREDILSSARRELIEESGLECLDLTLRGIITIEVEEQQGILMFLFSGENILGSLRPSIEGQPEWVDVENLRTLQVVEDIPLLVEIVMNRQSLFFGHYSYDEDGKLLTRFN
jgi:8-oxo-dGTP diphosphatase